MARENDAGIGNVLRHGTNLGITAFPVTMSCWFYIESLSPITSPGMVYLGADGSNTQYLVLQYRGDKSGELDAIQRSGGSSIAETTNTVGLLGWHHACGVFESTTLRRAILNGDFANEGSNTSTRSFPSSVDRCSTFAFDDSTPGEGLEGRLAEVGIWDVILTDNEISSLASGVCPSRVRTGSLQGYWPMYGISGAGERDLSGNGRDFAQVGTITTATHAPVSSGFGFDTAEGDILAGLLARLQDPIHRFGVTPFAR